MASGKRSGGISLNTDHYARAWSVARERLLAERSEVSAQQRRKLADGIAEWRGMLEAAYVRAHPPVVWGLQAAASSRG